MVYRTRVLAAAVVAVAGVFSGAAFGQSIEGVVLAGGLLASSAALFAAISSRKRLLRNANWL
jgi:hypothetical protein